MDRLQPNEIADALADQAQDMACEATDIGGTTHALVLAVLAVRAELRYLGDSMYGAAQGRGNG